MKILKKYKLMAELARRKAAKSLKNFILYTKDDYEIEWFHELICEYLDRLNRGEIKKLMIFLPPQHGKSELSSRRFPAFVLGQKPKEKIAICSYSQDLSMTFNRDCQDIIDSKEYLEVFKETKLAGVGQRNVLRNNHIFEVVGYKGFVKAVGVGTSLTGTPIDLGIVDDPFKDRLEANSLTIRNRKWEWYQDVFLTRLHNDSKQLLLFTRWHEDDIAGRILDPKNEHYDEEEAKEWTVIALPALKEKTKPIEQCLDINDPREIGEALWESRHSAKKYEKRKRINPTGFQSLDQQRPTAEGGNKIKGEWFKIIKKSELPFNPRAISADFFIDGAFTEKTSNDETGLGSCYYNKKDGNTYIFNISGVRKELYELLEYFKLYALANNYGAKSNVWIELKASGHPLKSMLSKMQYGAFNTRGIDGKHVALGKLNRVENSEPFMASGRIILVEGNWIKEFIDQCESFPNGSHDDMVDIITYIIHRYYLKKEGYGVSYKN